MTGGHLKIKEKCIHRQTYRRERSVSCAEVEKRNTGAKMSPSVSMGRYGKDVFYQTRSSNTNQIYTFHLGLHKKK